MCGPRLSPLTAGKGSSFPATPTTAILNLRRLSLNHKQTHHVSYNFAPSPSLSVSPVTPTYASTDSLIAKLQLAFSRQWLAPLWSSIAELAAFRHALEPWIYPPTWSWAIMSTDEVNIFLFNCTEVFLQVLHQCIRFLSPNPEFQVCF